MRIADTHGIERDKLKPGPRRMSDMPRVGDIHWQVGNFMFIYRQFIHGLSFAEMAELVKMSTTAIQKAEMGAHEFTLSELQRVAKVVCYRSEPLAPDLESRLPKDFFDMLTLRSNKMRAA